METLTGNEHFTYNGTPINKLVLDFWSWQSSDLLSDTIRAVLAEYIVATALDIDGSSKRSEWGDYDLAYKDINIEIKSASYIQADLWENRELSKKIVFRIAPSRSTFFKDNEVKRRSDIYVFCIFACQDRNTANPIQLEQWDFYIVRTSDINDILSDQKTMTLWRLTQLPHIKCSYEEIKNSIDKINSDKK